MHILHHLNTHAKKRNVGKKRCSEVKTRTSKGIMNEGSFTLLFKID